MSQEIRFTIPWNKALLKNNSYGYNPRAKGWKAVYLKSSTESARDSVVWKCRSLLTRLFFKNRIRVEIMDFKPSHKTDSINFVDHICDAIKRAISVDDHFFSLSVDWQIDKTNPRITIAVIQDSKDCFDLLDKKEKT